jgi:hypothetical protein
MESLDNYEKHANQLPGIIDADALYPNYLMQTGTGKHAGNGVKFISRVNFINIRGDFISMTSWEEERI